MMPMPSAMPAIVAKDAAVVTAMDIAVYERQVETHDLSVRIYPDFASQLAVARRFDISCVSSTTLTSRGAGMMNYIMPGAST